MLQWIFERLAKNNVKETVLAVNQLTEFYIKQNRVPKSGLKVRYSHDPPKKPLGTGGPVKHAERFLGHEPFLVLNGDIFADINYKELMEIHSKTGALATLSLCRVEDPTRYGVAEITKSGRITRFTEKPPKGTEPSNLINAGVYVLNPEVLQLIPEGRAVSIEREIFPKLATNGELFGHVVHGLWMDIGKPEEYLQTNKIILDAISVKRKRKRTSRFQLKEPIALDKDVSVADGAVIGPYAVLGKNVTVGKNTHIKDSVIFSGTNIGNSAWINGAIIGEEAEIGDHVKFGKGCIIADHAKITKGVSLTDDMAVCPAKVIS